MIDGDRGRGAGSTQFPPVVSFAGFSGSGKTTLATEVIRLLTGQGYRVGAIKHDAHEFEIDKPGKDSWRMTQAGAEVTVISNDDTLAMVRKLDKVVDLDGIIRTYYMEMDIVIVEGWKERGPNKIEVQRKEMMSDLLSAQPQARNFIAVACDYAVDSPLPRLDINQPQQVTDFIVGRFLQ